MKKIILGMILGFILATVTFAYADDVKQLIANKAAFPVLVNGKQLDTTQKPAVVINGSTYLPLKSIGTALNVNVNWNDAKKRVEVGSTPQDNTPVSTNSNIGLKILNSRIVKDTEIKNILPYNGFRFRLAEISITNTGNSTINVKPSDFKISYQVSAKINAADIQRIKDYTVSNFDGRIVRDEAVQTSKFTNIFADSEIKFGDLAPGQTIQGTILFQEADVNMDWFQISFGGTEVRSK